MGIELVFIIFLSVAFFGLLLVRLLTPPRPRISRRPRAVPLPRRPDYQHIAMMEYELGMREPPKGEPMGTVRGGGGGGRGEVVSIVNIDGLLDPSSPVTFAEQRRRLRRQAGIPEEGPYGSC
jgi:hypothetical protein